jgi:hypothetical protein
MEDVGIKQHLWYVSEFREQLKNYIVGRHPAIGSSSLLNGSLVE